MKITPDEYDYYCIKEREDLKFEVIELRKELKAQEELFTGLTSHKIALNLWRQKESEIKSLKEENSRLLEEKAKLIEENKELMDTISRAQEPT